MEDAVLLRNAKIALIVFVGLFTLLASLTPWFLRSIFKQRALDYLNVLAAFSAGLVFAAFLCHMLPSASDHFGAYFPLLRFPLANCLAGVAATLLVSLDRIIVSQGMHGEKEAPHAHDDHVSAAMQTMVRHVEATESTALVLRPHARAGSSSSSGGAGVEDSSSSSSSSSNSSSGACGEGALSEEECPAGSGEAGELSAAKRREATQKAWVFFLALSAHSVFDGLSLGSETTVSGFYSILIAVLVHKGFDGVALGVPIFLADLPPRHSWALLITCALSTPAGVAIGWGATASSPASIELASGVIISLSAGSFLFISLCELLPAALADGRSQVLKLGAFFLGFSAMAGLAVWI